MLYEIPLIPQAQAFTIALGSQVYGFRIHWCDTTEGGWVLDLLDSSSNVLIASLPLLPNADLLAQHKHLGVEGTLTLVAPGDLPAGYADLGATARLIFEAP